MGWPIEDMFPCLAGVYVRCNEMSQRAVTVGLARIVMDTTRNMPRVDARS